MTASNVSRIAKKAPARKAISTAARKAAATARQAEAEDGFVDIEHRGVKLRVPIKGKVPVSAIDAYRAGDAFESTKLMLGAKQWKLLSDAGMTLEELDELGRKLNEVSGN